MALERATIEAALERHDGNIGEAARELGASRRTLQNRMREYGMPRGKAGRRKRELPYGKVSGSALGVLGAAAVVGAGALLYRSRLRRQPPSTTGK